MAPTHSLTASASQSLPFPQVSARLLIIFFAAMSPSLGTAISASGRLALYLTAIAFVIGNLKGSLTPNKLQPQAWIGIILLTVAYMALSISWTSAEIALSSQSWSRHARLLTIPIVVMLVQTRAELIWALRIFVIGQLFVVLSSWLLVAGIYVPWATSGTAVSQYAVFGSYLEQSMTETVLAIILWFMRDFIFGIRYKPVAIALAMITVVHIYSSLNSRTGFLMCTAFVSYAVFVQLPKKLRLSALFLPLFVLALAFVTSEKVSVRLTQAANEVKTFSDKSDKNTSSGQRLTFWSASLTALSEQPLVGFGSGSWNREYRRIESTKLLPGTESVDNPHNLFFLWAVEGGLIGLGLLCAVFIAIARVARQLQPEWARTLIAILLALLVASVFTSTIYGIGLGDFFCVAIGLLLSAAKLSAAPKQQNQGAKNV